MPYHMRKLPSGKVQVSTPNGIKAKGATPRNAMRQVRLLRGIEHGWNPNKNAMAKRMGA